MKVIFLNPPVRDGPPPEKIFGCNYGIYPQQNIFMLYPAALLEREGYDVSFIDCPAEKLESFPSDGGLYVVESVFLSEENDKRWAKTISEYASVVFMGPEPTYRPGDFLLNDRCFVARGESEHTILELVRCLEADGGFDRVLGLSWRGVGGKVDNPPRPLLTNEELDALPFPARHLLRKELYYNPKLLGRPSATLMASRNCYGRCIYCIPSSYTFAREIESRRFFHCKPKVGLRSPENIIKEFRQLRGEGYMSVAVLDDNFINGRERTIQICEGVKDLGLEWGCLARADTIRDDGMVKAMAESDCKYVDLGVESFRQEVLDFVKKDLLVEDVERAIGLLKKHGIEPKINILVGVSPMDSEEDIDLTVRKLREMDIEYVSFSIAIPHPMTELYRVALDSGWFKTGTGDFKPADTYRESTIGHPGFSKTSLEEAVRRAYRRFYLNPSFIWKRLSGAGSLSRVLEDFRIALRLIR
ncbi:MAG: radical SAM protein [Candidatus Altiarchaeota archaeon]